MQLRLDGVSEPMIGSELDFLRVRGAGAPTWGLTVLVCAAPLSRPSGPEGGGGLRAGCSWRGCQVGLVQVSVEAASCLENSDLWWPRAGPVPGCPSGVCLFSCSVISHVTLR